MASYIPQGKLRLPHPNDDHVIVEMTGTYESVINYGIEFGWQEDEVYQNIEVEDEAEDALHLWKVLQDNLPF